MHIDKIMDKVLFKEMCDAISNNNSFILSHELCKNRFDIIIMLAIKYNVPIITDRYENVKDYYVIANKNMKSIHLLSFEQIDCYNNDIFLLDINCEKGFDIYKYIRKYKNKNFVGFI